MDIFKNNQDYHRCQSLGLGGPLPEQMLAGEVGPSHQKSIFQLQGVNGNTDGTDTGITRIEGRENSFLFGQHDSDFVYKSPGRNQNSIPSSIMSKDFFSSRIEKSFPFSNTFKGEREHNSGLPESSSIKTRRMVSEPGRVPTNNSGIWSTLSRPLCIPKQQEAGKILLPKSFRPTDWSRWPSTGLDIGIRVCLPAYLPDSDNNKKDPERRCLSTTDSPELAKESMVCESTKIGVTTTMAPANKRRSSLSGSNFPPETRKSASCSVDTEREIWLARGLSSEVVTTLLKSRKDVTSKKYLKIWKVFSTFLGYEPDPLIPPQISKILDFLHAGLEKHLKASTLKVQIAALSYFFHHKLADLPWIKRFVSAVTRSQSSPRCLSPPWDVNTVLSALSQDPFEPLDNIPVKILSYKMAFLLAITSARRISEIQAFSALSPYTTILDDKVIIRPIPTFRPKVVSDFHMSQDVILPSFCPNPSNTLEERFHCLDVRRCLLTYLKITSPWRIDENLLIQFQGKQKGHEVSSRVIAPWVKWAIHLSYSSLNLVPPSGFGAHSTRAIAASWAEKGNASLAQICRAATWSSPHTFFKHYRLQLDSDSVFGRRVLQAVVPP